MTHADYWVNFRAVYADLASTWKSAECLHQGQLYLVTSSSPRESKETAHSGRQTLSATWFYPMPASLPLSIAANCTITTSTVD